MDGSRTLVTTKHFFVNNILFIYTPCLPHHPHLVRWDQTKESRVHSLGSEQCRCDIISLLHPSLWNNLLLTFCSATSVATLRKHLKTHLFVLAFPHRHQHIRFAGEHWFSCRTTEPGYAKYIGALYKLDWVVNWYRRQLVGYIFDTSIPIDHHPKSVICSDHEFKWSNIIIQWRGPIFNRRSPWAVNNITGKKPVPLVRYLAYTHFIWF